MGASDRDHFLKLNDAFMETYPQFESIYYGLEDGVFAGHGFNEKVANYREPGHSGYVVSEEGDAGEEMQKHYVGCVNATSGEEVPCEMSVGGEFTECVNDCELIKCADEASQRDCEILGGGEVKEECEANVKWCKNYIISEAPEGAKLGYITRNTHCINKNGVPSQKKGEIAQMGTTEFTNCYFLDGVTPVNRNLTGNYAYCGGNGIVCDNTFYGAYLSRDYDPRWRGWYIATKEIQKPNWSPPYPFFTTQAMGITFSLPIYSTLNDGRNEFAGVLAVDYTFTDLTKFLQTSYLNSTTVVAIFEKDDPYFIVATSTGSKGVSLVLKADNSRRCSNVVTDDCIATRVPAAELAETEMDEVISNAFSRQQEAGFPEAELVTSRATGKEFLYATQTKAFTIEDADLNWKIMIMIPVETEQADQIVPGDALFAVLVAVGVLGVLCCAGLAGLLVRNRKKREIVVSDWRFMSAFVGACGLLNASTLSFLGPNTDVSLGNH